MCNNLSSKIINLPINKFPLKHFFASNLSSEEIIDAIMDIIVDKNGDNLRLLLGVDFSLILYVNI